MDLSLKITPKAFSGISAKMSEKRIPNANGGEVFTPKEFQMRKNGASLAFDLYKLPDFLSKTILKINKALIANEVQRQIYAKGFDETMRFLKSAAKAVK